MALASIVDRYPELAELDRCWLVGGFVRDVKLGRPGKDVDLAAVDAESVAERLAGAVGARAVRLGKHRLRTYRIAPASEDRVFDVTDLEGGSIEQDLARRDFTINAMAISIPDGDLTDPFGGARDLERRVIRMVSGENLVDDPLRLVRAVRLAMVLGFSIEEETFEWIRRNASTLDRVAVERISAELDLILGHVARSRGARLLRDLGLDLPILGRMIPAGAIRSLDRADLDLIASWTVLLDESSADEVRAVAERLRWSRDLRDGVVELQTLARRSPEDEHDLAMLVHDRGTRMAARVASIWELRERTEDATRLRRVIDERGAQLEALEPLLSGDEILHASGLDPGPRVGEIKRKLVEAQIRGEIRSREDALDLIRKS